MTVPEWALLSLTVGGAAVALVLLNLGRRTFARTTLVSPCVWAMIAISVVTGTEALIFWRSDGLSTNHTVALRWFATCSIFCPMMAQLGAKRPQDRGWQWIVLSLWVILALPAGEGLLLGRGVQISTARWGFTWALVVIGLFNMLPTRYWLSTLLVVVGQSALLLGHARGTSDSAAFGMCLIAIATVAAYWSAGRARDEAAPLDHAWRDFRDMFGAVWALRIGEQLNKVSNLCDWNIVARWEGFFDANSGERATDLPRATADAIEKSLRTQLRRFVSPAWLDARLPSAGDETDTP